MSFPHSKPLYSISISSCSYLTLVLLALSVYFMWMDVALYVAVQQVPPMATDRQPTHANISDYSYSPFYPITIKLLLQGMSH